MKDISVILLCLLAIAIGVGNMAFTAYSEANRGEMYVKKSEVPEKTKIQKCLEYYGQIAWVTKMRPELRFISSMDTYCENGVGEGLPQNIEWNWTPVEPTPRTMLHFEVNPKGTIEIIKPENEG